MNRSGYVVCEDCINGKVALWTVSMNPDRADTIPEMWESEEQVMKAIVMHYIEHLSQYIDDEREIGDTNLNGPDEYVGICVIENGRIEIKNMEGVVLLDEELSEWRKSL